MPLPLYQWAFPRGKVDHPCSASSYSCLSFLDSFETKGHLWAYSWKEKEESSCNHPPKMQSEWSHWWRDPLWWMELPVTAVIKGLAALPTRHTESQKEDRFLSSLTLIISSLVELLLCIKVVVRLKRPLMDAKTNDLKRRVSLKARVVTFNQL